MVPAFALEDFRQFLVLGFKHLGLGKPDPIQLDIAYRLQHGPSRHIIQAYRGVGKSLITSLFVIWRLAGDPTENIVVVSATSSRADEFTTFTLTILRSWDMVKYLAPKTKGQRSSNKGFDVGVVESGQFPSVASRGITGQLTGLRASLLIADDVEIPNNAETPNMRDKLREKVREFDALLKPGDASAIIYLGTPQTEETLYSKLQQSGYSLRIWPVRVPTLAELKTYGGCLAPIIAKHVGQVPSNTPVEPRRHGNEELAPREAQGRSWFTLQYMLNPSLSDAEKYPLKLSDLVVMGLDNTVGPEKVIWGSQPSMAWDDSLPCHGFAGDRYYRPVDLPSDQIGYKKYTNSVMSIDPSGRGKDELSFAVVKTLNSYLFLTKAGGLQGGYHEKNLEMLAKIAKAQNVNTVLIESNFGDGMFTTLFEPYLREHHPNCAIEEVRHSQMKENRIIDTLEPVMNQHRLVVDPQVIREDTESTSEYLPDEAMHYRLFHQMTRVMKVKGALRHDDRLDALAIAIAFLVEMMNLVPDEEIKKDRRKAWENQKQEWGRRNLANYNKNFRPRKGLFQHRTLHA